MHIEKDIEKDAACCNGVRVPTVTSADEYARFARAHLPEPLAQKWISLEGYGPLSFIAELDCAVVAAVTAVGGTDLLPESGHFLFFCVDERYEGPDKTVDYEWHMTEWTSGQMVYVPKGSARRPRPCGRPTHSAVGIGIILGDCPVVYWMIRDNDLATRRFDRIWFTMQN